MRWATTTSGKVTDSTVRAEDLTGTHLQAYAKNIIEYFLKIIFKETFANIMC